MGKTPDLPVQRAPIEALVGTRIRELRQARNANLTQVARDAGVSRRMLTLIEQGTANPSVLTLDRIAAALQTDVAHLLLRPDDRPPLAFRSAEAVHVLTLPSGGGAKLRARTTETNGPELWTWVLEPGDAHEVEATTERVEQLILVTSGLLYLVRGTESQSLTVGDSAVVESHVAHRYVNPGSKTCEFVQVSQSATQTQSDFATGPSEKLKAKP